MLYRLPYGVDSEAKLDLPPGTVVVQCATDGRGEQEPTAMTARALAEPLAFPPLAQATVPGDKVVLALESGVPDVAAVVSAVIDDLLARGLGLGDITVLRQPGDASQPLVLSRGASPEGPHMVTHDPSDRNGLALLGYTSAQHGVYLNRLLCDADLVLPIGSSRPPSPGDRGTISAGLYPAFSDAKTQLRFQAGLSGDQPVQRSAALTGEPDEVGWLLGIQFAIEVVPGPNGTALDVLAGQTRAVRERGRQLAEAAWKSVVPGRAELVVAAITGDVTQQSWENLGRTLAVASGLVSEGGSLAVCCAVDAPPGPAVERLRGQDDPWVTLRRMRREPPSDYRVAVQLAQALEGVRVYLLSLLDESLVEDLGMVWVGGASEISRLVERGKSAIVLTDAQFSCAAVDE
jgi:hypothetical protein